MFLSVILLPLLISSICSSVLEEVTDDVKLNIKGIIAAYGDFNADKATDIFIITQDGKTLELYTWDAKELHFSLLQSATINVGNEIVGVALADFNGDGSMDALISTKQVDSPGFVYSEVYLGDTKKLIGGKFDSLQMKDQPTIMDFNGDMYPDLFGINKDGIRSYWIWTPIEGSAGFHADPQPALSSALLSPNPNGFVDITNDYAADLVVMSKSSSNKQVMLEVWEQGDQNFTLSSSLVVKLGAKLYGMLSFADIDSDGVMDIVLPVCKTDDCSESLLYVQHANDDGQLKPENPASPVVEITWKVLLSNAGADWKFPAEDMKEGVKMPFKVHFADLNMDNLPDATAIFIKKDGNRKFASYMLNTKCTSSLLTGCNGTQSLTVKEILPKSGAIELPVSISFLDVYENGAMDIMITCQNKLNSKSFYLKILKNNFNTDTAFLKVAVLSGLQSSTKYGAVQIGASVSMDTENTDGKRLVGKTAQLSQSAYFSLQLPYIVFGLGKSPNFVEEIQVGIPIAYKDKKRVKSWNAIIPNAQVIVIPHPPNEPEEWVTKLLVTPSKLLLHTGGVLIGTCLLIAGIILILHIKEKREDEEEKRKEAHKFHFDAL